MAANDIRKVYLELFDLDDDQEKVRRLEKIKEQAVKTQLSDWELLIDGRIALVNDQFQVAIALSDKLLAHPNLDPEIRNWGRRNRASANLDAHNDVEAIADYTAVIDDPITTGELKARARHNRGLIYLKTDETDKAFADFNALIGDPTTPPELKAGTHLARGIAYGDKADIHKAIADYSAFLDDHNAATGLKARAHILRGFAYCNENEDVKGIADLRVVIDDPDASPAQKAQARIIRGISYAKNHEPDKAIADYTAVIDDPKAPDETKQYTSLLKSEIVRDPSGGGVKAIAELTLELDVGTRNSFRAKLEEGKKKKEDFFSIESSFDPKSSILLVLREWNSYTPAIPDADEPARGGGYFIKHGPTGVVVDPGFDFIENFWSAGGKLCDITHIVVTHAHNDHTADLEALLTLLFEFNDRTTSDKQKKKVDLYLSHGAMRKFSGLIQYKGCNYIGRIVILNPSRGGNVQTEELAADLHLTVLPAHHDDVLSDGYSVGLGFGFSYSEPELHRKLLITGDTALLPRNGQLPAEPVYEAYPNSFKESVDMVVAHIGSIMEFELEGPLAKLSGDDRKFQVPDKTYDKHLGLRGTFASFYRLRPHAGIVSEFGEEMKTIWIKAVRAIKQQLDKAINGAQIPVFPGDPYLIYDIATRRFLCHENLEFVDPSQLEIRSMYEPKVTGESHLVRPYLFLAGSNVVDDPEQQDRVRAFHAAMKNRTLPHFRKPGGTAKAT